MAFSIDSLLANNIKLTVNSTVVDAIDLAGNSCVQPCNDCDQSGYVCSTCFFYHHQNNYRTRPAFPTSPSISLFNLKAIQNSQFNSLPCMTPLNYQTNSFVSPSPASSSTSSVTSCPVAKGSSKSLKKKVNRLRSVFTFNQREELEKRFSNSRYINKLERKKLAEKIGLRDDQIKVWFQNRRSKESKRSLVTAIISN